MGPPGTTWGKRHHPLGERLCLFSSPWRSRSKVCSSGPASSFYIIFFEGFLTHPPVEYKLCNKGIDDRQLSSSLTSLISFFSMLAFSFTQNGKLEGESNTPSLHLSDAELISMVSKKASNLEDQYQNNTPCQWLTICPCPTPRSFFFCPSLSGKLTPAAVISLTSL